MKIKLLFLPLICFFLSFIPFISHASSDNLGYTDFYLNRNYTRNGDPWVSEDRHYSFSENAFVICEVLSDSTHPYKTGNFYVYSFSPFSVTLSGVNVSTFSGVSYRTVYGGSFLNGTFLSGSWPELGEVYTSSFGPCYIVSSSSARDSLLDRIIENQGLVDGLGDFEGDEDGDIDDSFVFPDEDQWIPDYDALPAPVINWNGDKSIAGKWTLFHCENARENYYIELRGSYFTLNEFSLSKKNLSWYVYYDSYFWSKWNGEVRWDNWISADQMVSAYTDDNINIASPCAESYRLFSLTLGNDLSNLVNLTNNENANKIGYMQALSKINCAVPAGYPRWLGCKVYARYFTFDNGIVNYGKWTPVEFGIPANGSNVGDSTIEDDPGDDEPNPGDPTDEDPSKDPEQDPGQDTGGGGGWIPDIPDDGGIFSLIIGWINNIINGVNQVDNVIVNFFNTSVNSLGQFPVLLARTFQFLPSWLISAISVGIAVSIILRIFGR